MGRGGRSVGGVGGGGGGRGVGWLDGEFFEEEACGIFF